MALQGDELVTTGSIGSREIVDGFQGFESASFGATTDRIGATARRSGPTRLPSAGAERMATSGRGRSSSR